MENLPIYYIPYARMREDFKPSYRGPLLKATEYPVYQNRSEVLFDPKETQLIAKGVMGVDIIGVPTSKVKLFVKIIIPKFKLGQVVVNNKGCANGPFRIFEYTIVQGKVWYRDGWGVSQNLESGAMENSLRLATEKEKQRWEVHYYDSLMVKFPILYNAHVPLDQRNPELFSQKTA